MIPILDPTIGFVVPDDAEQTALQKYRDDPLFRSLVDGQKNLLQSCNYTHYDLTLAAALAVVLAARRA